MQAASTLGVRRFRSSTWTGSSSRAARTGSDVLTLRIIETALDGGDNGSSTSTSQ
ncbi:MAG: hypothetical protein R3E12_01920 [Candidatus Eisenbacteria bacterium]